MRAAPVVGTAILLVQAVAQTPAGISPSTDINLGAQYLSTYVEPNILLPEDLVSNNPFIDANINYGGTYLALLVDQSISTAIFPSNETSSLVPGLGPDRTTRLHWWAGNVTQTSEGAFINRSAPIADYGGPMPPLNDIAHTYVLYLFNQPANFSLPAEFLEGYFNPISADTRMNFSVSAVAEWVGAPLAANYFRVQNPNNTNSTSTSGSGNVSTPSATPSLYTGSAAKVSQYANVALVFVGVAAFTLF